MHSNKLKIKQKIKQIKMNKYKKMDLLILLMIFILNKTTNKKKKQKKKKKN